MKTLWKASAYPLRRLALIAYDEENPRHERAMQWYIVVVGLYVFVNLVITWVLFAWAWWPCGVTWLAINVWATVQWLVIIRKQRERNRTKQ